MYTGSDSSGLRHDLFLRTLSQSGGRAGRYVGEGEHFPAFPGLSPQPALNAGKRSRSAKLIVHVSTGFSRRSRLRRRRSSRRQAPTSPRRARETRGSTRQSIPQITHSIPRRLTFLFGVLFGFWGVLLLVVAPYIDGTVPLEYIRWGYWLLAFIGGFLAGAAGTLLSTSVLVCTGTPRGEDAANVTADKAFPLGCQDDCMRAIWVSSRRPTC